MAGFISEWRPASNRNGGRHQIGIPGRIESEFALLMEKNDQISAVHYAAIGRVAVQWSRFESAVNRWLRKFANLEDGIAVCFTSQMMGPRSRIEALMALVKFLGANKKWNSILENFGTEATSLGEQRNRVIHDVWDLSNATNPIRKETSARRVVRLLDVPVSTIEINKLYDKITDLTEQLDETSTTIFDEIFPSLGKPPSMRQ